MWETSYPYIAQNLTNCWIKSQDAKQRTEAEKFLSLIVQNMFGLFLRVARLALTQNPNDYSIISQNQTPTDKENFPNSKWDQHSSPKCYTELRRGVWVWGGRMSLGWEVGVVEDLTTREQPPCQGKMNTLRTLFWKNKI